MEKDAAVETTATDKRHILLLGKSGNGKSSLGNNLLGAQKFSTSLIADRRTKTCQIEPTDNMVVLDTPGFFTMLRSDVDVAKEIMNTVTLNHLSIHVYILVLSVDERLSGDEKESLEFIKKLFGENVIKNMIVVFAGKDSLEDDELAEFQFPRCLPQMPYFILDCKHRKQEEMEKIQKEIFSEKYKNIHVFDADLIDWATIEKEEKGRKDSLKLDVDGFVDAVQSRLESTQPDVKSLQKQEKSSSQEMMEIDASVDPKTNDTRHIILLGKRGNGKSSLGNNLLGAQKFSTSLIEDRRTKTCQIEPTDNMVVVDTPGFFTMLRSDVDVAKEIMNTLKLHHLFIHVYILVLSADERLSGDEKESLEFIKRLFGENVINNMIVVFTGKDSLEDDELAEFQFPRCLPQMPYFILDCKHRKQEEMEKIQKEIFSEKYKDIHVFDADLIDWATIENEEKGRKDSLKLDVDGFVDAVQSRLESTQPDVKSLQKQEKSSSQEMMEIDASVDPKTNDTRHIILLGKSGNGKSSLGNNLLGAQKFSTSLIEDRRTKTCQIEPTDNMVVVDTPGFFSMSRSDVDVAKEIMNTLKLHQLFIHVYILVLSVDERLSGDEKESLEFIKKLFGENVINNMIVVFTGKDSLEDDELAEFQFPRCLPQMPYFILDCKHGKQKDMEKIQNEIFKYKYIPHTFDVDRIDWDNVEKEERRRKDSQKIDVDGYTDAVQSRLTQREGNSRFKPFKSFVTGLFNKLW